MKLETELPASVLAQSVAASPSEDKETEWNDEVEEAGTWPCRCREFEEPLVNGGYE